MKKQTFVCSSRDTTFFASDPHATELLLRHVPLSPCIWEPACGSGVMVNTLRRGGYTVTASDKYRQYSAQNFARYDFLSGGRSENDPAFAEPVNVDIVTCPPRNAVTAFAAAGLARLSRGHRICLLAGLNLMAGEANCRFLAENPPLQVLVLSERLEFADESDDTERSEYVADPQAWYIWTNPPAAETELRFL